MFQIKASNNPNYQKKTSITWNLYYNNNPSNKLAFLKNDNIEGVNPIKLTTSQIFGNGYTGDANELKVWFKSAFLIIKNSYILLNTLKF